MNRKSDKALSFDTTYDREEVEVSSSMMEETPFVPSEAEKKLVQKINWTFMPFVCLLIFIQVNTIKLFTA